MKLALDTNRYVDAARGVVEVAERLRFASEIYLPLMVLAELRSGFVAGSRQVENERLLARFFASPRVTLLAPDEQTTHTYAALHFQLRRQGTPIPTNDIWIASLVLQHGLTLYARDRHFDHLPQIPRV